MVETQKPIDYDALFEEVVGHEPTEGDREAVRGRLISEIERRRGGVGNSLNFTVAGVRDVYNGEDIGDSDLRSIMGTIASERKAEIRARDERSQARRARWRRFSGVVGGFMLGGVALGIGALTYTTLQDPAVDAAKQFYEHRKGELEQKFFGPLDALTSTSTTSSLTPLERELYLQAESGITRDELYNPDTTIYDQTFNGVNIIAKAFKQKVGTDYTRLLILKSGSDGGIVEAHSFYDESGSDDLSELFDDAKAERSILFSEKEMKVIDLIGETVREVQKNRTTYSGSPNDAYKDFIKRIHDDFVSLYNRGPNPQ